ncbi:FEKKY domain-containing protein [Confluentibacter citreus]
MNRKTIIFSGIILILIGIGLWNYGFFNRFNYLTAKSDIENNSPRKVLVGELMISPTEMDKISRKYGFTNIGFGCVVSGTELNGIEIHNAEIDKYLTNKNGTEWKADYLKEIDSLSELKQRDWKEKFE